MWEALFGLVLALLGFTAGVFVPVSLLALGMYLTARAADPEVATEITNL